MRRAKRRSRAQAVPSLLEPAIRVAFNGHFQCAAERRSVTVGRKSAHHDFALHEAGKVLGTIVERSERAFEAAATEILWLCLWEGPERRLVVTPELALAQRLVTAFQGCYFPTQIEAFHFDGASRSFYRTGRLGAD
ncbi:MAG: hypothetical protein ABI794_05870 [Betaproteobacteria bacterium]